MGLPIPPEHRTAVSSAAESFVRDYRKVENDPTLAEEAKLVRARAVATAALDAMARSAGESAGASALEWATAVFPYGTRADAQAFLWSPLFRRLAGITQGPLSPAPLSPSKLAAVVERIQHAMGDPAGRSRRIQAAAEAQRSPWEAQIDLTYVGGDPFDWVESAVEFVSTLSAWRAVKALLEDPEIEQLAQWGKAQARAMGMPEELLDSPRAIDPTETAS